MTSRIYTIGRVARLAGVTVKRVRFYADQKLLPPSARTERGYRLFTEEDLVRLDLICTLREAGFGLDDIRRILARPVALRDALSLRLKALEAQIASQARIAQVLRSVLASPDPSIDDLRRVHSMTSLTQTGRRAVIERFFGQFSAEPSINPKAVEMMRHAAAQDQPETLSPDQVEVWIELSRLMDDPVFAAEMRSKLETMAKDEDKHDKALMREGMDAALALVRAALSADAEPNAEVGGRIAETLITHSARAHDRTVEETRRMWVEGFTSSAPETNIGRYWRLMRQLWEERAVPATEGAREMHFLWTAVGAWRKAESVPAG